MSLERRNEASGESRSSEPSSEIKRRADDTGQRARVQLIIVDDDGTVILDSLSRSEDGEGTLLSNDRTALRGNVAIVVKALLDECVSKNLRQSRIESLDENRFVRLTRLAGGSGRSFAVTVEQFRDSDSLSRASRKYKLTAREIDVLGMILEGASAIETGLALNIAETTVQGYFKRLLSKTGSKNRPAMVANVLDWSGPELENINATRGVASRRTG